MSRRRKIIKILRAKSKPTTVDLLKGFIPVSAIPDERPKVTITNEKQNDLKANLNTLYKEQRMGTLTDIMMDKITKVSCSECPKCRYGVRATRDNVMRYTCWSFFGTQKETVITDDKCNNYEPKAGVISK